MKEAARIPEKRAKELLVRMAKAVGLDLVEWPKDAWYEKHWCFSNWKALFSNNYFSLGKMLRVMLGLGEFTRCLGTWDAKIGDKTQYSNPFCGFSLEELEVELDILGF